MAIVALFVSLGGVSYGVATGSIDSREVKNKSLRGKDLRANTITAREIKRRSLDGTDIKVNRVGGNAVKEEVLESGKIGKVPSAGSADSAAEAARVGGKTAAQLGTRWALINESGAIEAQSGGFTLTDCYSTNANCYINAGEDVRNRGIWAEVAVQNTDGTPRFTGETGAAPAAADRLRFYVFVTGEWGDGEHASFGGSGREPDPPGPARRRNPYDITGT